MGSLTEITRGKTSFYKFTECCGTLSMSLYRFWVLLLRDVQVREHVVQNLTSESILTFYFLGNTCPLKQ